MFLVAFLMPVQVYASSFPIHYLRLPIPSSASLLPFFRICRVSQTASAIETQLRDHILQLELRSVQQGYR